MNKTNVIRFIVCVLIATALKVCNIIPTGDAIGVRYNVESSLESYLDEFVALADDKGIDLSHIYGQDITIRLVDRDNGNVATSYGRDKDRIVIFVDRKRFKARSEQGRRYVMFHEFGHDILNLEHLDSGMMKPTSYTGFFKNYVEGTHDKYFSFENQEKYLMKSLDNMFDIYLDRQGDGISDTAGKWDIGGFNLLGYRLISFTNDATKEFYGFIGERGYKLIGIWKGEIAYAVETKSNIEVRDFNDKLLLTIKK